MKVYFNKFLFAVIFLGSAIGKIVEFDHSLIHFAGMTRISFPLLTSFLRILILIELIIPLLVWMNGFRSKIIYISIQSLLVIFLILNILFFFIGVENCGCFGVSVQSHPKVGILKIIFLLMIVNYLRKGRFFPVWLKVRKIS